MGRERERESERKRKREGRRKLVHAHVYTRNHDVIHKILLPLVSNYIKSFLDTIHTLQ